MLTGRTQFVETDGTTSLDYLLLCDHGWHVRSARVTGSRLEAAINVRIERRPDGVWRLDGEERPELRGCVDLDLEFTPATATLALRRLAMVPGSQGAATLARLTFPDFRLRPVAFSCRRTSLESYLYQEASAPELTRRLSVNEAGFASQIPGFWRAELESPVRH